MISSVFDSPAEDPARGTLAPPELGAHAMPPSVSSVGLAEVHGAGAVPLERFTGARAEEAYLRARVVDAGASLDVEAERIAARDLARLLAARGTDLDTATALARRSLSLGDDLELRRDLAGWLAGLGEPRLAAYVLEPLCDSAAATQESRALVQIAVLLSRGGELRGAIEALKHAVQLDERDAAAIELLGTLAAWATDEISAAEAAAQYLEAAKRRDAAGDRPIAHDNRLRAFEADPTNAEAANVLSALLDGPARDEVLRIHALALVATDPERARGIHKRRMLTALSAGDRERAMGACLDAHIEGDIDDDVADKVDELFAAMGLHELLALRLRLRSMRARASARSTIEETLGRLYEGPLASPERAVEAWIEAAASDPSNDAALAWLRGHWEHTHDPGPLVEALVCSALEDDGSGARLAALRELSAFAEDKLGDAALASFAFERRLQAGVEVDEAKAAIRRLAPRVRRHDEVLLAAQRTLAGIEAPEGRVEALKRLVILLAGSPERASDYIEVLAELAERLPAERSYVVMLTRLARRTATAAEAMSVLERVLRAQLASSLSRVEVVRLRLILAELEIRRGDEAAALAIAMPLLSEAPGHRGAASAALILAARVGGAADRAQALVQVSGPTTPALRSALLSLAAELEFGHGHVDEARECARLAMAADNDSVRAIAVGHLVGSLPRDRATAAALERAMALTIPRSSLSQALADLLEELGEDELALAWTERWLALRPGCMSAGAAVVRRATRVADAPRIVDAVAWAVVQPRLADELVAPLVEALFVLLSLDREQAMTFALRALDAFGPKVALLRDRLVELADRADYPPLAIAVLERWIAADPQVAAEEVLFDLLRRRTAAGDFDGAARVLIRIGGRDVDPKDVLVAIEATTAAAERIGHIFSADARVSMAEASLAALRRLPADPNGGLVAQGARTLAALLWDLADDRTSAERALFTAIQLTDSEQMDRYAHDLATLAGPESAVDAVVARAVALPDSIDAKERAGLLIAAAHLAHAHCLHERALAAAARAIELCPARADALALVEKSAHVEGGIELLDRTYHRLAGAAMGRYGRRAAHYRAARLLERRGALELALCHAAACFEAVPGEGTTYSLLIRLAERATDPTEVAAALERVARASPVDEQPMWLKRAADLAGGTEDGARLRLDLLLRSFSIRPCPATTAEVAQAMRELADLTGEREVVAMRFERAVTSSLGHLKGPEGARTAIVMATVAIEFDLCASAFASLNRAIVADADVDEYAHVIEHLPMLALNRESSAALLSHIQSEVDKPYSSVGSALLRFASGLAEVLNDERAHAALTAKLAVRAPDEAPQVGEEDRFDRLEDAAIEVEMTEGDRTEGADDRSAAETLEMLEQDAKERRDHGAIATIIARRIALADSEDLRRVLRLRRAAVLEQRLGRLEEACVELEAILVASPNDTSALRYLADLTEQLGVPSKAAVLLVHLVELSEKDEDRVGFGLRAARSFLRADDPGRASAMMERLATAIAATNGEALEIRAELARRFGDAPALSEALDRLATSPDGSAEHRAAIYLEAANAALGSGDEALALVRARSAVELAPDDPHATLEALRLEYRARGTGTPREAQDAVHELTRIADRLEPDQVELHAFLVAEELDVIQGGGAGMRELSRRHAEIGPLPLIALGMAERLIRNRSFEVALPLFERALRGSLHGLRVRGRVALAAAEAAMHVGELEVAASLLDEASNDPVTHAESIKRKLELDALIESTSEPEHGASEARAPRDDSTEPVNEDEGAPTLAELHRAALEDGNVDHARAIEHARCCFDAGTGPHATPPLLASQREDAALVGSLLFGSPKTPALEALALVWEAGLGRSEGPRSRLTGVERVQPFDGTVVGELYVDAARLLAVGRAELYYRRGPNPPRTELVLLQRPAVILDGEASEDSPRLRFALGAGLAATMAEHALALACPEEELRALFKAMAAAFGPLSAAPEMDWRVAQLQRDLWQIVTPAAERRLREIFESGAVMTPEHARQAALQNTRRAGLFICGDLAVAVTAAVDELQLAHTVPLTDAEGLASACAAHPVVRDLVRLATRAEYARARWHSGSSVRDGGSTRARG